MVVSKWPCNKLWNCPASKPLFELLFALRMHLTGLAHFLKEIFKEKLSHLNVPQYNDNKGNSVLFYDSIQYSVFSTKAVINKCWWCQNTCNCAQIIACAPTEICLCLAPAVVLPSAFINISWPSNWKIWLHLLCFVHLIQMDFCHRIKWEVIQFAFTVSQ